MIDAFHDLLTSLGQQLKTPLHPDKKGACTLNVRKTLSVQLEYEPSRERILMATFVAEVPPGKLRENILRDALRAHFPYPELGSFGYSERNNKLSLFHYISLHGLTGEKCAAILTSFIDKAIMWKEAVEMGQTATLISGSTSPTQLSPFNLKP